MTIMMIKVFLCCNVPRLANHDDYAHPHQNLHYDQRSSIDDDQLTMIIIIIVMMFQVYLCCNIPRLVLNLAEVIAEVIIRSAVLSFLKCPTHS